MIQQTYITPNSIAYKYPKSLSIHIGYQVREKASVLNYQKSLSVSMQKSVRQKAKIRDDLKAGGTLVKKFEAKLTKDGIKINLIK